MKKIFNKIICIFGFLALLQEVNETNSAQLPVNSIESEKVGAISNPRQVKVLKDQLESTGSHLYMTLDSYVFDIFNSYNYFMEYIDECCKFPMFFQIHESRFPETLIYLKPDEQSIQILNNLISIQSFFTGFHNSVLNIYKKLDDIFASDFFQTSSTIEEDFEEWPGQLETIPEETSDPIPLFKITPITSVDQIRFFHGLYEFRRFTQNLNSDGQFLFEISNLKKRFIKFSEDLNSMSRSVRNIYFSFSNFDNLKKESELVRLLFASIYDISKELSNNLYIFNKIYNLPSDLTAVYERLSLRNLMRSNFMEKLLGPSIERTPVFIPDITPVLFYIKTKLNLLNNSQAMELFSYISNLQLLNHPIGNYHNSINIEELIKIYNNILLSPKKLAIIF